MKAGDFLRYNVTCQYLHIHGNSQWQFHDGANGGLALQFRVKPPPVSNPTHNSLEFWGNTHHKILGPSPSSLTSLKPPLEIPWKFRTQFLQMFKWFNGQKKMRNLGVVLIVSNLLQQFQFCFKPASHEFQLETCTVILPTAVIVRLPLSESFKTFRHVAKCLELD